MNYTKETLENGLRVITVPMREVGSVTVQVFVGAGSRQETERTNGLAHFLEHMVFKGTKRYPSAKSISSVVDRVGGEMNAYTFKEKTAFYIHVMKNHKSLAFDVLSEFIKHPLLKPKDIEKEKSVILEEIAMYEDLPVRRAPEIFENLLYPGISLGWDIAGKKENIKAIRREDFIKYRQNFYYPENLVLVAAGNIKHKEAVELAERKFDIKSKGKSQKLKIEENIRVNPGARPQVKLLEKKTEQAHMVLGVRANPLGSSERFKEAVLCSLLGGGMSSRMFTQVREQRGLAYYVSSYLEYFTDNGYLAVRAGIKLGKEKEAVKVMLEEFAKVSGRVGKDGITQEEIDKAKEYTKGKLILDLEDTEQVADFFGSQELLEKRIMTPEEVISKIDKVTVEDAVELAKMLFHPSKLNFAMVGPYNDPSNFEQLLKI